MAAAAGRGSRGAGRSMHASAPTSRSTRPGRSAIAAFHFALIDCGSPVLLDFCRQLHDRFDRYRRLAIANKALMADIGSDHDRIMASALNGDAERAVGLLDQHIAATAELVLENYDIETADR